MDAPPQLLLSALTWSGFPTTWCAGDGDELVGTYAKSATAQLNKAEINAELGAVVYTPATQTSFQYARHTNTSTSSSEVTYYGVTCGENMPPLARICLPGRLPWPERFKRADPHSYPQRPLKGPPFDFYTMDWTEDTGINPENLHGLTFSPDLPGQPENDTAPIFTGGREQDSSVGLGWHGNWATALLEKQDRGQLLGERTEIMWDTKEDPTWGVQVRLQAIQVTEVDPDMYEEVDPDEYEDEESPVHSRGISDYEVQATILRVFVKSEGFVRLQEPDEIQDEDESEEEFDDDDEDM
ncbi:hypothetical protein B0H13DRAFT_744422 [Mycena leptocephala]|nr:hypothetical protein B0H13DRAFT_993743 [Mycena leptocephala]KAJ7904816.1 hypothetical protein B0H13DRAFT_744422 [Mycena leptocephala]